MPGVERPRTEGGDRLRKSVTFDRSKSAINGRTPSHVNGVLPAKKKIPPKKAEENGMKHKDNTNGVSHDHVDIDDDAHLKVTYSPGKKGGNYGLPIGAKLSVPEGLFGKKDTISCHVASPAQRWRHSPVLPSYEHITSEIFIFNSTVHPLKKTVIVQLPYYPINTEHHELNVKGKWKDETEWVNVGFLQKEGSSKPCVELEVERLGVFVVTFTPKKETFDVTTQGCLYNAHISRYISIRFPKKASDKNFQCAIQITPISSDKIDIAKEFFPDEMNDFVLATEFIDLIPSVPCNFRRAVTVKLPLPAGVEAEEDSSNHTSIAVYQKMEAGWELVESKYKFTRTTVSFDVKTLSRFCVAQSKPERTKRIVSAIPVLEGRTDKEKGEMVAFLNIQEKFWFMTIECFPESKLEGRVKEMTEKGFRVVNKQMLKKDDVIDNKFISGRRPPPKVPKTHQLNGFELHDGMMWTMEMVGDIKVGYESDFLESKEMQYFRYLPESCRKTVIEPKTNEERAISCAINFTPHDINDPRLRDAASFSLVIDLDITTVIDYFRPEEVPEEPEPTVKEKPNLDLLNFNFKQEEKPQIPIIPKFKPLPPLVMERLMKTSRKPVIVEKESKAISGKSLRILSRMVPEGLTLAVHLDLPDSTITGLGFDAISNGLSMSDVTYKILLYWKRQMKDKRDGAIERLASALKDMGRGDVASLVSECHKDSKELSLEAYEAIHTS